MIISKNIDKELKKISEMIRPYFEKVIREKFFDKQSRLLWKEITEIANKYFIECQYNGLIEKYKVICNGKNNSLDSTQLNLKLIITGKYEKYIFEFTATGETFDYKERYL